MRYETIVPYRDQLADEGMGLYAATLTYCCAFLDLNERANKAVIAYGAFIQVRRLNNRYVLAKCHISYSNLFDFWLMRR